MKQKLNPTLKDVAIKAPITKFDSTLPMEHRKLYLSMTVYDQVNLDKDYEAIKRLKERNYISGFAISGHFDERLAAAVIKRMDK